MFIEGTVPVPLQGQHTMLIADLNEIEGRTYPARRRTKNLVGGASPIQIDEFCMGFVVLEPNGGQVPWHNHEQEEIYFIVEGEGEMCLGEERQVLSAGQTVFIPSWVFHQLTNTGDTPMKMVYCYGPAGRCGALETGTRRHTPESRCRSTTTPRRRSPPMH